MNSINDDVTVDGWLALCVAIVRGVPQQEAFRMLYNPFSRRKWTEDDFREIEYLKRNGATWNDIGEMLGVTGSNALKQYRHWKEKQKKSG